MAGAQTNSLRECVSNSRDDKDYRIGSTPTDGGLAAMLRTTCTRILCLCRIRVGYSHVCRSLFLLRRRSFRPGVKQHKINYYKYLYI